MANTACLPARACRPYDRDAPPAGQCTSAIAVACFQAYQTSGASRVLSRAAGRGCPPTRPPPSGRVIAGGRYVGTDHSLLHHAFVEAASVVRMAVPFPSGKCRRASTKALAPRPAPSENNSTPLTAAATAGCCQRPRAPSGGLSSTVRRRSHRPRGRRQTRRRRRLQRARRRPPALQMPASSPASPVLSPCLP